MMILSRIIVSPQNMVHKLLENCSKNKILVFLCHTRKKIFVEWMMLRSVSSGKLLIFADEGLLAKRTKVRAWINKFSRMRGGGSRLSLSRFQTHSL
jgi:hypothetical protein